MPVQNDLPEFFVPKQFRFEIRYFPVELYVLVQELLALIPLATGELRLSF